MFMKRNYLIDNCKAIAIFCVVLSHFIETFKQNNCLLLIMYSFQIPVFVFFSGYLAKYDLKKMIKKILVPYLVMQVIFYVFYLFFEPDGFYIFLPYPSLWYLLSLFCWLLLIKLFENFEYKYLLFVSCLAFSLIIGYDISVNRILSLSRTIVYFPIFLLGYYVRKYYMLKKISTKGINKIFSLILFLIVVISIYIFKDKLDVTYFYGSYPYSNDYYNFFMRFLIYLSNFIGIYMFLNWIPKKKTFISKIGQNSISVYLLHYIIIKFMYYILYDDIIKFKYLLALEFLLSTILVFLLSNNFFARVFRKNL